MFDIDKILGNKKTKKNVKFTDMTLSNTFGKNPFSDMVGNLTNKPLNKMGASNHMQNKWANMNTQQRTKARKKHKDSDGDRVPDIFDCSPFNTMRQDINFGRKPRGITQDQWSKQKDILNKSTFKTNTSLDPLTKMNTILEHDKDINRLKKVHSVFHDDEWQKKFNMTSINALKKQGYNDDDATEFIANQNKTKAETAAYFAQELAKDNKIGHLFKGAIPDIPMTREEGKKRYEKFQNNSQFISGVGIVDKPKKEENKRYDNMFDMDIVDMEERENFEYEQEEEARKHYNKLKQKSYNQLSYNEREFVDSMATEGMNMNEMNNYYKKRADEINTNNPKDRWQTYEDIYEKEYEGKPLTQKEKDYQKYHDLVDEDYSKLSPQEKDFIKEYRFKQGFDEDILEGEDSEVDSEEEFYRWKNNRR